MLLRNLQDMPYGWDTMSYIRTGWSKPSACGCPSSKAKLAFDFQLLQTLGKHIPVLRPKSTRNLHQVENQQTILLDLQ